jgi:riboflavin kinase/FMN adenylyltransferase
MRVVRVPEDPPPAQPPEAVVTIGNFDGVHRGHQALIRRVVQEAAARRLASAVVTFEPHPRLVLRPDQPVRLLSTLEEKIEQLARLGVDELVVWRFDYQTQQLTAEEFLQRLCRWVRVRRLIHGPGFALGRGRQGTPPVIAAIGRRLGFEVEALHPLLVSLPTVPGHTPPGEPAAPVPVSSSAIRAMIEAGQVGAAAAALGRPPTLTGIVVPGERLGRALGFPTANLEVPEIQVVPADGVYAAWAELVPGHGDSEGCSSACGTQQHPGGGVRAPGTQPIRRWPAAVSIGTRPQFGGTRRVVEAHLLDFDGDLYGTRMRLHFVARLRGQQRFSGVEELVEQIRHDVARVRRLLQHSPREPAAEHELLAADGG